MRRIFIFLISIFICASASAREVYSLNDDWQFFYKLDTSSDNARRISLPHTWNLDALAGQGTYHQTTANYSRNIFVPAEWMGKRLFIKFHGVQSVADLFVNGHHVGEHRGGWTAFTFEITKHLEYGKENSLVVVVSNAYQNNVLPTSSEENLYGGIYRDVELIVTEPTTISPLYYGTDGVIVHHNKITDTSVDATVSVYITTLSEKACDLALTVRAPTGDVVLSRYIKGRIEGNNKPINIPITLEEPLLWYPSEPNLYTITVGIGTHEEDQVSVTTGFRRIEASAESGLKINGERVPIRGVALHHDRAAIGSALRTRHYDEDLEQIRDIGANAIRSTTAPHAQYLYDRCDEMGMLAWIDMPFTRAPYLSDVFYYATNSFRDNGLQQLREIILQNYNHPSVVMWGIYSLIWLRGDNVLDYVRELNSTAKALDPSRATVACSNQDGDINFITDLIVWQQSLGWERGVIDDVKVWSDKLHTEWSHLCSAVAYGEGGSIDQQTDLPLKSGEIDKRWLPEQWHTSLHEGYAKILNTDEKFWGIWINNMYEFGSVRHNDGISRTGLITFDHKDKKDAYYLYRALWNKEQPTLHITEKRRNVRQDSMQVVKVYSSAAEAPTLLVNKEAVTLNEVAPCIYESDAVPMTPRTQVVVKAGEMEDHTTITIGNALVQSR